MKIGIVVPVTVGGMAALSHLTHRDMGSHYDVGYIIDHVIATFDSCNQKPYTADAAVESIWTLLVK